MFEDLKDRLISTQLSDDEKGRIKTALSHVNSAGYDEWGVDPQALATGIAAMKGIYSKYFRVESVGLEKLPEGKMLIIGNHGGQFPVDGMLIVMSMLLEGQPPRLARGMVERWAPAMPFISTLFARCGQITGDQRNCRELLMHDQVVMVFPEGVGGSGKTIYNRYQLQKFGTGFMRLALETGAPIVPVAVIGSEETYPAFASPKWLARMVRAPYIPITPTFPFLGPLGLVPLPTKITLRYCKPMYFEGDPDMPDAEIQERVESVKRVIQAEVNLGLERRGGRIFTGSGR